MNLFSFFAFLLAVPPTVLACEGDCIVGVTTAFLGRYRDVVSSTMKSLAGQISQVMPNHPSPSDALAYLQPLMDIYQSQSYDDMEKSIFPSYFHGKCLNEKGQVPDGCPNPDCPVVCGTPGSLVHFYGKLRYIAYNSTRNVLKENSTPGSETYLKMEQNVLGGIQASKTKARMLALRRVSGQEYNVIEDDRSGFSNLVKRADDENGEDHAREEFKMIIRRLPLILLTTCGGTGGGETNELPECSWGVEMKKLILSYP